MYEFYNIYEIINSLHQYYQYEPEVLITACWLYKHTQHVTDKHISTTSLIVVCYLLAVKYLASFDDEIVYSDVIEDYQLQDVLNLQECVVLERYILHKVNYNLHGGLNMFIGIETDDVSDIIKVFTQT